MGFAVWAVAVVLSILVALPGEKTKVILVPDSDGHVGQVEVSTAAGSQLLTEAGQMTVVRSASQPPSAVTKVAEKDINTIFAAALKAEPALPEKFLLYFLPDSTELTAASLDILPGIIDSINQRHSSYISIFGHSDRVGTEAYNLNLSAERVLAVRQLLADRGVVVEQIETASHGEGNPLIKTADGVAEPRNRRVEVIVR